MPTGTNIGYNEVLSTKILTRYTTRTGVQWIIIDYNGKLLAKMLSLNYKNCCQFRPLNRLYCHYNRFFA